MSPGKSRTGNRFIVARALVVFKVWILLQCLTNPSEIAVSKDAKTTGEEWL